MTDLYVIQCDDDPYCAPYAGAICKSLNDAISIAKTTEDFRCIELYTGNDNCVKPSRRYFNAQGQEIDYKGNPTTGNNQQQNNTTEFDNEIAEALRLAGVELN